MSPERLYGVHPVLEALRSKARRFEHIYLQEGRHGRQVEEVLSLARAARVTVLLKPREFLDRLAGSDAHQGMVGVVAARPVMDLDGVIAASSGHASPLLLILDGIEDPHNLGAILRTAEAAGVQGVIVPDRRASGLTAAVAKASAGAIEHLPVAQVVNLSRAIERVKAANFWVYGLDPKGTRNYLEVDYRGPVALVVGGEGRGMRPLVAEHCDERVHIPMQGKVSSLNASVAAAILLYEVVRQRNEERSPTHAEGE